MFKKRLLVLMITAVFSYQGKVSAQKALEKGGTLTMNDQLLEEKKGVFSRSGISKINDFTLRLPKYLTARDGVLLAYYDFVPEKKPKAVIIFYHGGGIYSNKPYQFIGKELLEKYEIASYMIDIRGHGHSGGARGDTPSVETVFSDVDDVIQHVKQDYPDARLYLVGHSSGAGMLLNYNSWKLRQQDATRPFCDGYIFLAPYLGIYSGANKLPTDPKKSFVKGARTWVYIANALTGGFFFRHTPSVFFNHPEHLLKRDPLILPYYTCAMSLATSPYKPKALFEELTVPFALYIGSEDECFWPEKIVAYKDYADKVKEDSFAEIIPGVTHLLQYEAPCLIDKAINELQKNHS